MKTAFNIKTGQKVAVKIVNRQKLHPRDIDAFLREVSFQKDAIRNLLNDKEIARWKCYEHWIILTSSR